MEKIIHHIRRVRRQPEDVRQSILHILTLASGVILFLLWVLSLGSGSSESSTSQTLQDDLAPFSALKANLTDGYNSVYDEGELDPEVPEEGLYVDPNY